MMGRLCSYTSVELVIRVGRKAVVPTASNSRHARVKSSSVRLASEKSTP